VPNASANSIAVGGDLLLVVQDLGDRLSWTSDDLGEFGDGPAALFEFVSQVLAGRKDLGGSQCGCHGCPLSVVVDDLDDNEQPTVVVGPDSENQSPLLVESNR